MNPEERRRLGWGEPRYNENSARCNPAGGPIGWGVRARVALVYLTLYTPSYVLILSDAGRWNGTVWPVDDDCCSEYNLAEAMHKKIVQKSSIDFAESWFHWLGFTEGPWGGAGS